MKLTVLADGRLALPALQQLLNKQLVSAIGVSEKKPEIIELFTQVAKDHNVPLTVFARKGFGDQLQAWLQQYGPHAVFVITYPYRIPERLLSVPKHGFINFHFGLLPQMRGADPIFETIRRRLPVAGTTVHVMDKSFDTGPIIMREEIPVQPQFTYGMLSAQLAYQGAAMSLKLYEQLASTGSMTTTPQNESEAQYYPALTAGAFGLNWETMPSAELIAFINAANPTSPRGVPTAVNGWTIGVCFASLIQVTGDLSTYPPGVILAIDPQNGLLVLANDGLAVKLEVIYAEEGYFPGYMLATFGLQPGMKLD